MCSTPLPLSGGSEISEGIKKFTEGLKRNEISGGFELRSDDSLMKNKTEKDGSHLSKSRTLKNNMFCSHFSEVSKLFMHIPHVTTTSPLRNTSVNKSILNHKRISWL